jgi:hypothetical protein
MPLAAWVLALVAPIVKKVFVALGVGVITYASLNFLGTQITNAVLGAWGGVSGSILQIVSLAGLPDCIGITLGAINARIALIAVSKFGRIAQ